MVENFERKEKKKLSKDYILAEGRQNRHCVVLNDNQQKWPHGNTSAAKS